MAKSNAELARLWAEKYADFRKEEAGKDRAEAARRAEQARKGGKR